MFSAKKFGLWLIVIGAILAAAGTYSRIIHSNWGNLLLGISLLLTAVGVIIFTIRALK